MRPGASFAGAGHGSSKVDLWEGETPQGGVSGAFNVVSGERPLFEGIFDEQVEVTQDPP